MLFSQQKIVLLIGIEKELAIVYWTNAKRKHRIKIGNGKIMTKDSAAILI